MIARKLVLWVDERLGIAPFAQHALRKAFPDHWSFMLGEINVYCFLVLLATGTFLALFFDPSLDPVRYTGAYRLLDASVVSQAYASALRISFEVNGGLLVRQVHHWAALVFIAGIVTHMGRVFFTGAFRKPREINWVLGVVLFLLAMGAGFTGYSLPGDLLSGVGLRIADSVLLSVPLAGGWVSNLLLDGNFPSHAMEPRLFVAHVYLLPAAIAGAIALHLAILWRQKHSQFPGPGRTEHNVVGSPLYPNYAAKSAALFGMTAAVLFGLGALVQINPIWLYGPYQPWLGVSPAQPDWYVGWLDGALRLGPPWALQIFGHTVPSPFFPAVLLPGALFAMLVAWPWIERAFSRDHRAHQLLERPRDVPLRTAFGAAVVIFAFGLTLAGSGDVQARYAHVPITTITAFYRWFCMLAPLAGGALVWTIARELKQSGGVHEATRVRLRRNASGGFDEEPIE